MYDIICREVVSVNKSLSEKISDFVEKIVLPNIMWYLVISTFSALYGMKYVVAGVLEIIKLGSPSALSLIIAGICIVTCIACIVVGVAVIWNLRKHDMVGKNINDGIVIPEIEMGYEIDKAEFELYLKDRETITQRQTIKFRVVGEELKSIPVNMNWSGSGYGGSFLTKETIDKGYKLEVERNSSPIIRLYVVFPEAKHCGDTGEFSIESHLEDKTHTMWPTLGRLIKCKTKQLCLKVIAPPGLISKCERFVTVDQVGDIVLSPAVDVPKERIADYICYQHTFKDLELIRYYRLKWEFVDTN